MNALPTADLDYVLPPALIAAHPAEPRDAARLLVVRREQGRVEHRVVRELPGLLDAGDCVVVNTSRVVPARFRGTRRDTGGKVEGLFLRESAPGRWIVLLEAKRARPGMTIDVGSPAAGGPVSLVLDDRTGEEPGSWSVRVEPADEPSLRILERLGEAPLPPYIRRARRTAGESEESPADRDRYQTVFAREAGSVAAPTAGLHFTPSLIEQLGERGVTRAEVTLHVGVGTFRPVEADDVAAHPMHAEWCSMSSHASAAIERTRAAGRRVVCVGSTAARTVETYAALTGPPPDAVQTRLLILPGYRWRWTDALLTNFHLPRSTLMALVAAMLPGGVPQLRAIYDEAIARRYRFYSYGDAMLIL